MSAAPDAQPRTARKSDGSSIRAVHAAALLWKALRAARIRAHPRRGGSPHSACGPLPAATAEELGGQRNGIATGVAGVTVAVLSTVVKGEIRTPVIVPGAAGAVVASKGEIIGLSGLQRRHAVAYYIK